LMPQSVEMTDAANDWLNGNASKDDWNSDTEEWIT
jgi:hypothetical protein